MTDGGEIVAENSNVSADKGNSLPDSFDDTLWLVFDHGEEGSLGDNNSGVLVVKETFWSDASIHFLLHGVNKQHQILVIVMLDTAFHDENNHSLGLGDTGGVVTPKFVFFFFCKK